MSANKYRHRGKRHHKRHQEAAVKRVTVVSWHGQRWLRHKQRHSTEGCCLRKLQAGQLQQWPTTAAGASGAQPWAYWSLWKALIKLRLGLLILKLKIIANFVLLWTGLCPQNPYVEALTSNVTEFGDGACKEVTEVK